MGFKLRHEDIVGNVKPVLRFFRIEFFSKLFAVASGNSIFTLFGVDLLFCCAAWDDRHLRFSIGFTQQPSV